MQYTISFQKDLKYLDEDYIISKSNFNAYYLIKSWPNIWGIYPYSKVLAICGPSSSGKTHLVNIWQRYAKAIFISYSDDVTKLYKTGECFIIDDIDKNWPEQKLLHVFNILHENSKFLILTSCIYPPDFILPDLISRLSSIFTIKLDQPDDEMIKIILMREFSERSLKVSIDVINYLACRLTREFKTINETVKLIDKYSLENKRNITVPLVKELLQQQIS